MSVKICQFFVQLSLVDFGLVKLILVQFGLGKAYGLVNLVCLTLVSLIKADVKNKTSVQTHPGCAAIYIDCLLL